MKKVIALVMVIILIMALCAGSALAADGTEAVLSNNDLGYAPVAAIVVICYLVAAALKATPMDNKWLPVICGVCGGALGALGLVIMPEYPAQDWMTAIAIGIVSGLAATGVNQVHKQLSKAE